MTTPPPSGDRGTATPGGGAPTPGGGTTTARRSVSAVFGRRRTPAEARRADLRHTYPLGRRILAAMLGVRLPLGGERFGAAGRVAAAEPSPSPSGGLRAGLAVVGWTLVYAVRWPIDRVGTWARRIRCARDVRRLRRRMPHGLRPIVTLGRSEPSHHGAPAGDNRNTAPSVSPAQAGTYGTWSRPGHDWVALGPVTMARDRRILWIGAVAVLLAVAVVTASLVRVGNGTGPEGHVPPTGCATGALTLVGSPELQKVLHTAAEDYQDQCHDAHIQLALEGAQSAEQALAHGGASGRLAAFTARPLEDAKGAGLVGTPVGAATYAVVVNQDSGVTDLTLPQLRALYSGDATSWEAVGGGDVPVRLVGEEESSPIRRTFEQTVLDGGAEPPTSSSDCRSATKAGSPVRCERSGAAAVLKAVDEQPGAIGYVQVRPDGSTQGPFVDENGKKYAHVRMVSLHQATPTTTAITEGHYPFWAVQHAYTKGTPSHDSMAESFLAYLTSPDAPRILRALGYLPCTGVLERICARG